MAKTKNEEKENNIIKYFFAFVISLLIVAPATGYFVYQYMYAQIFEIENEYNSQISSLNEELKNYEDIKKAQRAEKIPAYFLEESDDAGQKNVWRLWKNINGKEEKTNLLIDKESEGVFKAQISPSGEKVAYWNNNKLFVADIKTASSTELVQSIPCNDTVNNTDINWDNSSENILYKVTASSTNVGEGCLDKIYSINIETKKTELLSEIIISESIGLHSEIAGFIPEMNINSANKEDITMQEEENSEPEKETEEESNKDDAEKNIDKDSNDSKEDNSKEAEDLAPVEEVESVEKESSVEPSDLETQSNSENEEAIVADSSPEETVELTATVNEEEYKTVMNYITANFSSLGSSYTKGAYTISQFDFTQKSPYTYVVYKDEENSKKLLVSYGSDKYSVSAYYIKGESQDWVLSSGKDSVYSEAKEVFFVNSTGGIASSTEVTQGYRYFESATHKFRMEYPSNWYYAGQGSGTYYFSDKPIDESSPLIILKIVPSSTQNQSSSDTIYKYTKRSETENYEISGIAKYSEYINTMAGSIESL